ncbi:MAG TPA: hypothetical protein VM848_03705 [Acidimicrobiia bacterium]|nr:hypothetical protein [Acidimicrobiia bacterium]
MSDHQRLSNLRIGYSAYSADLSKPGDRRRFPHYAQCRGISLELADPAETYDMVVLSARSDLAHWVDSPASTRIVYDLIDSYLAIPESDFKARLRGLSKYAIGELSRPAWSYRRTIERMARRADAVVCSTVEQKQMLEEFCPNVHVILDFHTELAGPRKDRYESSQPFRLVWEGLPKNLHGFRDIAEVLDHVSRDHPLALHLVTDSHYFEFLDRVWRRSSHRLARRIFESSEIHAWNPKTLISVATSSDLAVIPLDLNDPFAAGKPENKLFVFWRLGVPALVSATPAHRRAMAAAGLDMAAAHPEEWEARLRLLIAEESTRRRAGRLGAGYAEAEAGESPLIEKWDAVVESLW